ncbi:MAG: recombination regulator RecX [Desulfotignum sp.]|nr:recombination regulator RecX [Desulfotignum sp.]MCF8112418.1 recombination regulator RecX [Desulfotignum sp.]MCF8124769.1 recombination regulator RecX [Desulfotignum sp.]
MTLFEPRNPGMEKAVNMAVRYLGIRPRSIKEMEHYLEKKGWDQEIISTVVSQLKQHHYLDDETFARMFIENRKKNNPKSKFALTCELRQKGICSSILETLLKDYDDTRMACRALMKKQRQWLHLRPDVKQKKAMNYLRYRGFGYDVCRRAWEDFLVQAKQMEM